MHEQLKLERFIDMFDMNYYCLNVWCDMWRLYSCLKSKLLLMLLTTSGMVIPFSHGIETESCWS